MNREREMIAAMAMMGLVANPHLGQQQPERIAAQACSLADALINELDKDVKKS